MPTLIDAKILIRTCLKTAGVKYFNDENHFDEFDVRLDLRGKAAGMAGYKSRFGERHYFLRFNVEAMRLDWDGFVNDTIPHEIAHIICFMCPEMGKNHDAGWQNVCIALGGSGKLYHSLKLTPGRRTKKFMYVASCGTEIVLSTIRHNKVQRGTTFTLKSTRGRINNTCQYKQVA